MSQISSHRRPQDQSLGRFRTGFDRLLQDFENDFLLPTAFHSFPFGAATSQQQLQPSRSATAALLKTDVKETDGSFEMKVDMPGVNKEDITITVDDSTSAITVTTERREEKKEESEGGWLLRERSFGKAQRTQVLPQSADLSKAQVELKDGTLHFTVPKREVPGSRTLSIK